MLPTSEAPQKLLQTRPQPFRLVVYNDFRNDPRIVALCRKMAHLERIGYPMASTHNKHPDQLRLWEEFTSIVERNYPELCMKKRPK